MLIGVADTHAVIWYLYNNPNLSSRARTFIETASSQGNQIGVSSISLVEIVYLIEKVQIPAETLTRLSTALKNPENVLAEVPLDLEITRSLSRVSWSQVPDMPDRIIAATALYLNVALISRDGRIRASDIQTIW